MSTFCLANLPEFLCRRIPLTRLHRSPSLLNLSFLLQNALSGRRMPRSTSESIRGYASGLPGSAGRRWCGHSIYWTFYLHIFQLSGLLHGAPTLFVSLPMRC